jgi:hypothetical protein
MVGSVLGLNYAPLITLDSWTSGCKDGFDNSCKSSGAVLRFSMALSIVFLVLLLGTTCVTKFYDYLWMAKFFFFFGFVILFGFLTAEIFDLNGYAWFARVAAFFYLIFQQIILIDLAYTWNETWVRMSDEDAEHGYGCIWLFLLIVVSFTLILGSCAVIGIMFWQFGKCADSLVILILTVLLCAVSTFLQIFVSEDGSVLTSSIIIAYATYICYSSLTLNPNPVCNPTLSTGYQTVSQVTPNPPYSTLLNSSQHLHSHLHSNFLSLPHSLFVITGNLVGCWNGYHYIVPAVGRHYDTYVLTHCLNTLNITLTHH